MAIKRGGRTLTPRQQAAYVREMTGWTREQYNRQYDLARNRVRAYERSTGQKLPMSVSDYIARRERSKMYGAYYGREGLGGIYAVVESAPATSSGRRVSSSAQARVVSIEMQRITDRYRGIAEKSKYSAQIAGELDAAREAAAVAGRELTPAEYEKILRKYADKLETERKQVEETNKANPDPFQKIEFRS